MIKEDAERRQTRFMRKCVRRAKGLIWMRITKMKRKSLRKQNVWQKTRRMRESQRLSLKMKRKCLWKQNVVIMELEQKGGTGRIRWKKQFLCNSNDFSIRNYTG